MLFIPNDAIEALFLPKMAFESQETVDFSSGLAFPTLQDSFKGLFLPQEGPHDRMHVVWHDNVSVQLVTLTVEVAHGVHNDVCRGGFHQAATAHALVQPALDAAHGFVRKLFELLIVGGR